MAETKHTQENLAYIRTHVDNLERMVRFQIAANPASTDAIRRSFGQRKGMAEVYLALEDGPRTQEELMGLVKQSQANISKILRHLFDAGMVDRATAEPRRVVYRWTDLEEMLRVSKIAREVVKTQLARTTVSVPSDDREA